MKQQHESDLNNPKERFVWAFRGIEYKGSPIAMAEPVVETFSEHLSKCGFIHVSQLEELADEYGNLSLYDFPYEQEIHYQPPVQGQDHLMNLAGRWQSVSEPIQKSRVEIAKLFTPAEREELLQAFREDGMNV